MILLNLTNDQVDLIKLTIASFDMVTQFSSDEYYKMSESMQELQEYITNEEERYFIDKQKEDKQ